MLTPDYDAVDDADEVDNDSSNSRRSPFSELNGSAIEEGMIMEKNIEIIRTINLARFPNPRAPGSNIQIYVSWGT